MQLQCAGLLLEHPVVGVYWDTLLQTLQSGHAVVSWSELVAIGPT